MFQNKGEALVFRVFVDTLIFDEDLLWWLEDSFAGYFEEDVRMYSFYNMGVEIQYIVIRSRVK